MKAAKDIRSNVRYPRELRDDIDKIQNILIPVTVTSGNANSNSMDSGNSSTVNRGGNITISQIADIEVTEGPGMIRDENGMLSGYVFIDVNNRDIGSYVNEIKKVIKNNIAIPSGYSYAFSGQYEFMERVKERLKISTSSDPPDNFCTDFLKHKVLYQNFHYSHCCPVFIDRRDLDFILSAVQHVYRGLVRDHSAPRS